MDVAWSQLLIPVFRRQESPKRPTCPPVDPGSEGEHEGCSHLDGARSWMRPRISLFSVRLNHGKQELGDLEAITSQGETGTVILEGIKARKVMVPVSGK